MFTVFTIPKPFVGLTGVIQRNAIRSWLELRPPCEVILCGDDEGVGATATELNLRWIPQVSRNEFGTPLLDSLFSQASEQAAEPVLCYANADIILTSNMLEAIGKLSFADFVATGQRWDVDISDPIDFSNPEWRERVLESVRTRGSLHRPDAMDYFIMPRESQLTHLPRFAVGRPVWDNWMVYRARFLHLPVIDATQSITAVHQNHTYGHVQRATGDRWEGPEADVNRELLGDRKRLFTLKDATHTMTDNGPVPVRRSVKRFVSELEVLEALHPHLAIVIEPALRVASLARRALIGLRRRSLDEPRGY